MISIIISEVDINANMNVMVIWDTDVLELFLGCNDCTAYTFNHFKKEKLGIKVYIYLGFSSVHTRPMVNTKAQICRYAQIF